MTMEDHWKSLPQSHTTTSTRMTPTRYETNQDIALLSNLGPGYKRIAKYENMPVSTIQGVVKQYRMQGSIQDVVHSRRTSKQTTKLKQQIKAKIEQNLWASLREITESLRDLNVGQTTVSKVARNLGFKLRVP
ncbi:hypothetical protein L873DRAFT_1844801 [Choiromyces venosus 120613-1]|uniref:Transposase Tc1-like domain-containing protein n=1 Tax=Choiromyces venosus 120613-1 TaxID=1336337 RepID=A0A3N4JGP8_9PEZI|nr:hypothetical protein L873DRAFT_1844801 [Choiromyces venosus 120613-1]